MIHVVFIFMHY